MNDLLYTISTSYSRFSASFSHTEHLHKARFARPHELMPLHAGSMARLLRQGSAARLLLGLGPYGHPLCVRPQVARPELGNVLVTAPTRGGKGLLAVSQLLTWPHSVIVNDIKGELFKATAGYRATLGPVFVIDPDGVGHSYDPLLNKHSEKDLMSAANHLLHRPDEREGIIFTERATVMLTQLLLAARLVERPPLPYVRYLVRLGLYGAASKLQELSPELATQFLDTQFEHADFSDKFLLSCWGTLSARMRLLLSDTVTNCFTRTAFTARDIMTGDTPVTVYLRWPERDLLALSPLVKLLWGSLIDELINTYDSVNGKNCHPVLLLVDEAGRTKIDSLADHATTVNGRGISLWIAIQSLSQLEAIYGRARARILRDNMDSQLYYRPTDQETADYLERCLGRRSGFAHSQTTHEGELAKRGQAEAGSPILTLIDGGKMD